MNFLSFVFKSVCYGLVVGAVILFLLPELRSKSSHSYNIFDGSVNSAEPISYARAVNMAAPAVVNIYSESFETSPRYRFRTVARGRLGSGVIMDERGYIITADHVISNADQIIVVLQNGEQLNANIIGRDEFTDLAVLKVSAENLPVIPKNEDRETLVGDVVLAIGNPHNLGQTITQGIVSAVGRNGLSPTSYREFLQTDAAINPGNSGGALVNTNGELVGISSASFNQLSRNQDIQGIFFAVPYKLANKVMKQLIENGRVIRGWLGVDTRQVLLDQKGFIIADVTPGGPAQLAGLQSGDTVYQINDIQIKDVTQALDMVAETKPDTILQFHIIRGEEKLVLPVRIMEVQSRR